MTHPAPPRPRPRKRRSLSRRFSREAHGVMAVEFSLIAPVMIMMLFGLIELTDAILAKRRLYMAASMVGDLTTNRAEDWVHEDDLDRTFSVTQRVLEPYGLEDTTIRLTAVTWDDTKKQPVVEWSRIRVTDGEQEKNEADGYKKGEIFKPLQAEQEQFLTGNETIVKQGDHVLVAEISYPFVSSLSNIVFGEFDLNVQEVRVPRRSRTMAFCESDKSGADCTDGRNYLENEGRAGEMEPI